MRIREILTQRNHLESRILELGGKIPKRWPWDRSGQLRNLQLLELVELLEEKRRAAARKR